MKEADVQMLAKKIFKAIENDLRDRRGIRHEWERVDSEIQKEIRETNIENIAAYLRPLKANLK